MAPEPKHGSGGFVPPGSPLFRTFFFSNAVLESYRHLLSKLPRNRRWTLGKTCFDGALLVLPEAATKDFDAIETPTGALRRMPRFGQIDPPDLSQIVENLGIRKVAPDVPADWVAPGRVDLRDWFDAVEYQGFCASCVAFALVAMAEASARIALRQPSLPSLSEAALFFGSGNCWSGWNLEDGLRRFQDRGTIPRHAAPYEGHNPARPIAVSRNRLTAVHDYYHVHEDALGARYLLATHGPLVAEMAVHPEFFLYKKGVYRPVTREVVAVHAICIAGYDDLKRAWLCRNSFGTNWGEDGYFWVAYDACLFEDGDFWGIRSFRRIDGDAPPAPRRRRKT